MSAVVLRRTLITFIVLLIPLAGVGFYFGQSWLRTYAVSVSNTVAESKLNDTSLQSLSQLQKNLATQQDIIAKTTTLQTSSSTYQTQAVQDLITYATATGITISDYSFPVAQITSATANSLPTTQITIKLTSPVSYISLLKFMTAIEGNIPKMQIASVNLGRIAGDTASVKIDQLTIAVYTR